MELWNASLKEKCCLRDFLQLFSCFIEQIIIAGKFENFLIANTPLLVISFSSQVLVGWWLMFCLIVSTGFRSSLIAHLTVQGKIQPPKTMKDLVEADNWRWSTEPWLLKGVPHEYFSRHPDPVVQKIYDEMEVSFKVVLWRIKVGGQEIGENEVEWNDFKKAVEEYKSSVQKVSYSFVALPHVRWNNQNTL